MTMISHTKTRAPSRPNFRISLRFFARLPDMFFKGHRDSKITQDLTQADDAILKDIGVTRVNVGGKARLFPHPYD